MAKSIVLELQEMAADSSIKVGDLLRKALIVSTKLRLGEFKTWISRELNGYEPGEELPEYRHLRAEMAAVNPIHGLRPLYIHDAKLEEVLCNIPYRSPIGNAVSSLEPKAGNEQAPLILPLPSQLKLRIMEGMNLRLEPLRLVSESQLHLLIDAVRSTILEWSLKLEEEGILGDGMTFSNEEKEKAATSNQVHIGSFQGVFGDISYSQVAQNLQMTIGTGDFGSLAEHLKSHGVEEPDIAELQQAIEADPKPTDIAKLGPDVSAWYGKMVGKAASGAWNIGAGTAAGLLSAALAKYFGLA